MFGTLIDRIKWLGVILLGVAIFMVVTGRGGELAAMGAQIGTFFGQVLGFFGAIFKNLLPGGAKLPHL